MAATYYSQILKRWDWEQLVRETLSTACHDDDTHTQCEEGCDESGHIGSIFIGTVINQYPSGKLWTLWTTNQTKRDMKQDTAFGQALERAAEKYGGSIDSGEGDPNDLYFVRYWDNADLVCDDCGQVAKHDYSVDH